MSDWTVLYHAQYKLSSAEGIYCFLKPRALHKPESVVGCWLPDTCGFHTPGVSNGPGGHNGGRTTMHCFTEYSSSLHTPLLPRSSVLGFWAPSSEVNHCPRPMPQYRLPFIFSAPDRSHMSTFLPESIPYFPGDSSPIPTPCIWRTQILKNDSRNLRFRSNRYCGLSG